MDTASDPAQPLARWEKWAVGIFLGVVVLFGAAVERRSVFMQRRMGDLGCYLRAAWAVRAGLDLYGVREENGWHYNYPPLYAILMTPLADPPAGADRAGTLPYVVSVAVCYVLNVLCLFGAMHVLASALEQTSPDPAARAVPRWSRRWWLLRLLPVYAFLPPIGHTLMRGQANLLLLLLICGLIAGLMRGRRFVAGLCLAGAICLKIFPAFLLLVPLWQRDGRCLGGCAAGLLAGLILIPLSVLGPQRTVGAYRELAVVLVGPALGVGEDRTRAEELTNVTATDSQSFLAVLHNTIYLDREQRPKEAAPPVRWAAWLIGGVFTLLTLAAAYRRRAADGPAVPLFVGALMLVMILLSPVCHTHYFVLSTPLFMTLLERTWERTPSILSRPVAADAGMLLVMGVQLVGNTLPLLPGCELLKDAGLAMYTALLLWLLACVALLRPAQPTANSVGGGPIAAAA